MYTQSVETRSEAAMVGGFNVALALVAVLFFYVAIPVAVVVGVGRLRRGEELFPGHDGFEKALLAVIWGIILSLVAFGIGAGILSALGVIR